MVRGPASAEHLGMTNTDQHEGKYERGENGLLADPDAARREARRGWLMLTAVFAGGGVLVALAALVT
jgi:hypothetical protein